MPGKQRSGIRHFRPARSAFLSNTAHGACGPARRIVEAPGIRRVGTQTGSWSGYL